MLNAATLKLDFKENGEISVTGVAAGALPGGFSVKERIFRKAQPEVILTEDFQNENRQWEAAVFGGKTPDPGCELIAENGETFIRVGDPNICQG